MSAVQVSINQLAYEQDKHSAIVIDKIELAIAENECVCIVGPSGCGKTTLLNTIAGLISSPQANIEFSHENARLGYIFQEPRLMPWLTLEQNIALVLPTPKPKLVAQVLDEVGLLAYAKHYPNTLSGGMLRRASIARAFVIKPQILLLDEPFVSLDAPTAMQSRELLINMAKAYQTTVVFVTHNINEALFLADRIIFLSTRPSKVIHELHLSRTGDAYESSAQHIIKASLLSKYPRILEGVVNKNTHRHPRAGGDLPPSTAI